MIKPFRARTVINLILLAGLLGSLGCASTRSPIPEALRTETPTIGVVLRPTDSDAELQIPREGWRGQLANAGQGTLAGAALLGVQGVGCGIGMLVCIPAFATVGALGGAVYGAVTAEPASEWEQAESAFKGILSDLTIQQRVPDHIIEFAQSQTPYRVIRVENKDPSSKDEEAAYRALASKGIDAVLELTAVTVHLRPSEIAAKPRLIVMMDLRARLIRTSDGALLDDRVITDGTLTDSDSKFAWSLATLANPYVPAFREEVTQAAQRLAQQVVRELLSDIPSANEVQDPALQALNR